MRGSELDTADTLTPSSRSRVTAGQRPAPLKWTQVGSQDGITSSNARYPSRLSNRCSNAGPSLPILLFTSAQESASHPAIGSAGGRGKDVPSDAAPAWTIHRRISSVHHCAGVRGGSENLPYIG